MKTWLDVDALDWFYRSVLEVDSRYVDFEKTEKIIEGKLYNVFEDGYPRKVYTFVSTPNQSKFECEGLKHSNKQTIYIYVDGVITTPSKLEDGAVYLSNPISGGIEVVVYVSGVPKMMDTGLNNCAKTPMQTTAGVAYPSAALEEGANYEFNIRYSANERLVTLNRQAKRVNVTVNPGESVQTALTRVMGYDTNLFTIIDGVLYTSYDLQDFPAKVSYVYISGAGQATYRTNEPITPTTGRGYYRDYFFPNINPTKAEFFVMLERMRKNLYGRYTDRKITNVAVGQLDRYIRDKVNIVDKWYAEDILNLLNETFADGCYVFPLYSDDTFSPSACITRAEMVTHLNRFIEWALERFR